jgi:hypothetical protein
MKEKEEKFKRFLPPRSVSLSLSISSSIHCPLLKNNFRFFGLTYRKSDPRPAVAVLVKEHGGSDIFCLKFPVFWFLPFLLPQSTLFYFVLYLFMIYLTTLSISQNSVEW